MALFKTFARLFLTLQIVTTNAQEYTYITNTTASKVYTAVGYKEENFVQKWIAEGNAIYKALEYIYSKPGKFFEGDGDIEFIVGSTGDNTCSYIYGEAERLENKNLKRTEKPSKIIVVYSLNYLKGASAATEFEEFKKALRKLSDAAALHTPQILIEVKQFRPVANERITLDLDFDYQDVDITMMTQTQEDTQHKIINTLHTEVGVDETEIIEPKKFEELLKNVKVKKIVDGIAGSEVEAVDANNQLLTAIPRAQIRIMASAILWLKDEDVGVLVISNDNPSGMDENGNWTIDKQFWYPVNIIMSCVWHKPLVNSRYLRNRPTILALDITYNGKRLINKLRKIISQDPTTTYKLENDISMAQGRASKGVFTFEANSYRTQMILV